MIRFRYHRGSLIDSMATAKVYATSKDVRDEILNHLSSLGVDADHRDIRTCEYVVDDRIDWRGNFIVTVDGWGVVGFAEDNIASPPVTPPVTPPAPPSR